MKVFAYFAVASALYTNSNFHGFQEKGKVIILILFSKILRFLESNRTVNNTSLPTQRFIERH